MNLIDEPTKKGILTLVATPIGNLEDMTLRALHVLQEADIIAAEDTRQTLKLLNHFNIKKPLISYYEHNKAVKGNVLVKILEEGKNIALVSDAGCPGISDPGEDLVKLAIENGIEVSMAPGAAACIMGVVLSGLPTGRFVFEGFLPMSKKFRRERLKALKNEVRTMVFYEAPHKLLHTLRDIHETLGDRKIALARELTKKFEEIIRCSLQEAILKYENESPKGEFVLILEGLAEEEVVQEAMRKWDELTLEEHVQLYLGQGMEKKEAMKRVAQDRGISKRDVYNKLI